MSPEQEIEKLRADNQALREEKRGCVCGRPAGVENGETTLGDAACLLRAFGLRCEPELRDTCNRVVEGLTLLAADMADAAGELLVPIPEPGSVMSKLLSANVLMRRELAALRTSTPQASPNDTPARASHVGNGEDSERLDWLEANKTIVVEWGDWDPQGAGWLPTEFGTVLPHDRTPRPSQTIREAIDAARGQSPSTRSPERVTKAPHEFGPL